MSNGLDQSVAINRCGRLRGAFLKKLDESFCNETQAFYLRYNDDIIILLRSKSQFVRAKKRLKKVLLDLKLTLSPTKTLRVKSMMDFIFQGYVLRGRNPSKNALKLNHRQPFLYINAVIPWALEKVKLMQASAGSPEKVQSYLRRWARWWAKMHCDIGYEDVMGAWLGGVRLYTGSAAAPVRAHKTTTTCRWISINRAE